MHAFGAPSCFGSTDDLLGYGHSELSMYTCRYDGYDDSYNNASSSLTEEVSSPNGSSKGLQVGSHVIGTHRHRDVWNQQIKESNEKAKTQIKHGFKVSFCLRYANLLSSAATCCWTFYRCVGQIA